MNGNFISSCQTSMPPINIDGDGNTTVETALVGLKQFFDLFTSSVCFQRFKRLL